MIDVILYSLFVVVLIPFVAYIVAKLATYGYLKAKHNFKKDHENGTEP